MPRMYNPVIDVPCPLEASDDLARDVLRALGTGPSTDLGSRVAPMLAACVSASDAKGAYKLYNPAICSLPPEYTEPAIKLVGTMVVLHGRTVYEKLDKAKHCALLAATLGIDEETLRIELVRNADDETVFNACLDAMMKRCADIVGNKITEGAMARDLYTDDLLALGDDGFPEGQVSDILFYTKAEDKLGIELVEDETGNAHVRPTRSVVGLIALFDPSKGKKRSCALCHYREFCNIRAIGMTCHGRKRTFKDE